MPDGFTPIFKAAGTGHRAGAVPDPGPDTPASYVLRADATWGTGGFIPLPPAPTGPGGDNLACKIAGYLVQEVVRQCFQVALNQITGVGGFQGLIFQVLDLLPFSADIIPWAVDSTVSLIERIVAGGLISEVETWLEDRLWNLIGCYVYSIVDPAVGWTQETWQALIDFVLAIPVIPGPVLELVADFLRELGVDAANALAALASNVDYDCSACTGPYSGATGLATGPNTTGLPLNYDSGLTVSDGGTGYVLKVGQLDFSGATVTGLIGASGGTWGNIAQVSGLQGAAGPQGDTGPRGDTGPMGIGITDQGALLGKVESDTTWKALLVPGTPLPSGWELRSFDDSGWANAVAGPAVQAIGTSAVIASATAGGAGDAAGYRKTFSVASPGDAVAVRVQWATDAAPPRGVWLNDALLSGAGNPGWAGSTLNLPLATLYAAGSILTATGNVLAIEGSNASGQVAVLTAELGWYGLPTGPTGPQGDVGDTGPQGDTGPAGGGIAIFAFATITAPVTISGTSEATATVVVTLPSVTLTGGEVEVTFAAPEAVPNTFIAFILYDDTAGTVLGEIGGLSATIGWPLRVSSLFQPAAGARVFSIRAYKVGGNGTVYAGPGGSGQFAPAYARLLGY